MCGRYASFREAQDLADEFALASITDDVRLMPPSWNVAPTDGVRMVVERPERLEDGSHGAIERTLRSARWGLVPSWAKDPAIGTKMINARAETLLEKPAFKRAFATRRALLPADGYYEWQPPAPGSPAKTKQPIYIHAADGAPLAMAGLYEFWNDPAKAQDDPTRWLVTAAVITTTAVDEMGQIHDRHSRSSCSPTGGTPGSTPRSTGRAPPRSSPHCRRGWSSPRSRPRSTRSARTGRS